jgi:protein archease
VVPISRLPAGYAGVNPMPDFEEIEHTADWSFRVRGASLAQLLENAARAMHSFLPTEVEGKSSVRAVEVEGVDRETLLVNWLNEILYLEERHGEIYQRFEISELSETHLRARVQGGCSPGGSHIKAVTFHNLAIRQTSEGFEATVIVDV